MNRRVFLRCSGMGALLGMTAFGATSQEHQKPSVGQRPNILWICTDQQRYDTIGALNNPHIRTPNLDKLVKTGTAFNYAYTQSPVCTPSRSSFLTGYYPRTIRSTKNGNERWVEAAPLVTKLLADVGYDCGLAGKFHLSSAMNRTEPRPKDDGYRVFHLSHHPNIRASEKDVKNAYFDWLRDKGHNPKTLYEKNGYFPAELHQTRWCTDMAIDFIKAPQKRPWLFSLNCYDPHPPLDPPQSYVDRFDLDVIPDPPYRPSDAFENEKLKDVYFQNTFGQRTGPEARLDLAKYWAQIELIDDNIGRLLETLEQTGQRENTLIIFTSDHGNMVGHHGLMNKGCRLYDGLVRVPLIFSWPGVVQQNVASNALVELVDIAPTLLEINQIEFPAANAPDAALKGKSLLGLLKGDTDAHTHKDCAYSGYTSTMECDSYGTMIRTRKYKLVVYHGVDWGQLYDMENDPDEFENLWNSPKFTDLKLELMKKVFDFTVLTIDKGSPNIGKY